MGKKIGVFKILITFINGVHVYWNMRHKWGRMD